MPISFQLATQLCITFAFSTEEKVGEIVIQGVDKEDGEEPVFVDRTQVSDLGVKIVDLRNSFADGGHVRLDVYSCY